jgi:hypothetical protein
MPRSQYSSFDHDHRAVFEHHRVHVVGYLWERSLQFGSDAARDKHNRQAITPGMPDRLHGMRHYAAVRSKRAVEVDRDHLEKRHSVTVLLPTTVV